MTAEDTNALTSARLDLWLWSVRIFKTRSLAADECKGGHVRVNDAPAKPSQKLKKGDIVKVRYPGWERVFKVEKLLIKRVGAPIAVTCYEDLSGTRRRLPLHAPGRQTRTRQRPPHQEGTPRPRRTTRPRRLKRISHAYLAECTPPRARVPAAAAGSSLEE